MTWLIYDHKSETDWEHLPETICKWFNQALGNDDQRPSAEGYSLLANKLRVSFSRADNRELVRQAMSNGVTVDDSQLRDPTPQDIYNQRLAPFMEAARRLAYEAERLAAFFGNYTWDDGIRDPVSVTDLCFLLESIGAFPKSPTAKEAQLGRPEEPWHSTGREISDFIRNCLIDAGHKSRLSPQDEKSRTALICTMAIKWAYKIKLRPSGFAKAMSSRDRKKPTPTPTFGERFPDDERLSKLMSPEDQKAHQFGPSLPKS